MKRERSALLLPEWPSTDRSLWLTANSQGGFLEPDGKAVHWREATRKEVFKRYGLWLGFLSSAGLLNAASRPTDRVTEASLKGYLLWLEARGNASTTISTTIRNLREALRVMEPDADITLLDDLTKTLKVREVPVRDKHARVVHVDTLLTGALAFLDEVPERSYFSRLHQAGKYRDGLVVAFLSCRPVRLSNVTSMCLGKHMLRSNDGWYCRFEAEEMKDNLSLDFPFPKRLEPYLETYLDEYRPLLLRGRETPDIWISARGTPMSKQSVYCNTCSLTEELCGKPVNPHLFRDCAATTFATEDPEHILAIGRILGHASINTSIRHYNQSQMIAAADVYHQVMSDLESDGGWS